MKSNNPTKRLSFFRRVEDVEIIAPLKFYKAIPIIWTPFILLILIGYANFGGELLSPSHWATARGNFIPPIVGVPCLISTLLAALYISVDAIMAKGAYVSIFRGIILINRRKRYRINDIDIGTLELTGLFNNIIRFEMKASGRSVSIPMIFTNIDGNSLMDIIKCRVM